MRRLVLLLGVAALLAGCASATRRPPTVDYSPVGQAQQRAALDADAAFGADLMPTLPAGNLVFSPYSISTALQMALVGARGNTATQLAAALHRTGVPDAALLAAAATLRHELGAGTVQVSYGLWPQRGLRLQPAFTAALRVGFGAHVTSLDYENNAAGAVRTINAAVSKATHGKVPALFDHLDPSTRVVLTDAVHLKAAWATPFDPHATLAQPFHLAGGSSVRAEFMHETATLRYAHRDGLQIVQLPYAGGRFAMTVVVPDGALPAGVSAADLAGLQPTPVSLALPRFTIRTSANLVPQLRRLGVTDAFDHAADFSGIDGRHDLSISQVVHQAYVAVGETGTEAAAATGVGMTTTARAVTPQAIAVIADRPFLFAITDLATGAPLFVGRVADPAVG